MGVPQILGSYGKLCSDRASTIAGELVVVDGNAVLFHLWTGDDDRRRCGGDYRTFVRRLQDFVLSLVSAGVKPFFVFDGSTRPSVPLEESKADSVLVKILPAMHLSLVEASLRPLNVPYFVPVTVADPIVAYMSRRLGAPVITPDTDIVCYGVRTVRTDGPVFCSERATLEVPVCGLDGSEIADKFGLTVPHVGLMKMLSMFVFPSERILVASSSELAEDLALDMAREQSPSVEVVPSHQTQDIRKLVSERLGGLTSRRRCRSFELVKVLGIRYDDDLRRLALTLSGEELVCLWTRVCADAEKDLGLREGLKRLLALPRPVFLAVRKNGTALRQLVPAFRFRVWQACGSFQFNHEPEPRSAGSLLLAACRRTVSVLCPKPAKRSQPRRNKDLQLLASLPDIFGENVSDSVRFDRTLEIFYHLTQLNRRRVQQLNSFPGWRRTVVACLVMWRGNRHFDVPEVFLQAAVLTHMHLSDMIELPGVAEDLKLGRLAFASNSDKNFKSIMEASAFATYEALKAVATWLDTLLTLLGNPLPPVRPEHLFSGPVYLKALELLAAKPLSELASEQGFTSKLDGTLAEDYFRAVLAVCTETCPVPENAKWHGTLIETGCKRVLGVHLVKSGKNRTDVGRQPGASGGEQGTLGVMVGPTRPGFFSSRWWREYRAAVVRLKMAKQRVKLAKIKMALRRTTMINLEERKLRVCFYKARLLDDEERLSGVDFEKNPEKRAAYLRELKEFGDESIIPSRGSREVFTAKGVKVKSTRRRK